MRRTHQTLFVVGVAAIAIALVVATGGFSAMISERAVSVDVVADDDAFLGVEQSVESSPVTAVDDDESALLSTNETDDGDTIEADETTSDSTTETSNDSTSDTSTETTSDTPKQTSLEVTVTNQFAGGTTLETVAVTVDGDTESVGPLQSGERRSVTFDDVDCGDEFTVEATGTGTAIELTRTVEC